MKLPQEFDLHALEVFVMTVELGGMSQCASHLQVTQSAVSQTIAKLEAGIGASLFDRTMRPLGLTASGMPKHPLYCPKTSQPRAWCEPPHWS